MSSSIPNSAKLISSLLSINSELLILAIVFFAPSLLAKTLTVILTVSFEVTAINRSVFLISACFKTLIEVALPFKTRISRRISA